MWAPFPLDLWSLSSAMLFLASLVYASLVVSIWVLSWGLVLLAFLGHVLAISAAVAWSPGQCCDILSSHTAWHCWSCLANRYCKASSGICCGKPLFCSCLTRARHTYKGSWAIVPLQLQWTFMGTGFRGKGVLGWKMRFEVVRKSHTNRIQILTCLGNYQKINH